MEISGFTVIDEDAGVLVRQYAFTKGANATTLVFRGEDGLVVVSPSRGLDARDYDALRELGEVRALVANNAYHHLGQQAWRARFPDAVSYAPPKAIPRLVEKSGVTYRSLDELVLPAHVRCEVVAGFKTGETLVRVATRKGTLWYVGDLLANMQTLPKPPVRWLFTATDSAPGFKLFRPAVWMLVEDRAAVRAWMLAKLDEDPPAVVVPAHGLPFETGDVAAAVSAQLARL